MKLKKLLTRPQRTHLAQRLAKNEMSLHCQLVHARELSDLTRRDVAEFLGVDEKWVRDVEGLHSNPTLSEIRYYALAVGAVVEYQVKFEEELS